MKIYTDNKLDSAILTSENALTNYPVSNLQDTRLSRIYKSTTSDIITIYGGGESKGIYEEYTNLIQDPCDLTTSNWMTVNGVTATLTDITVKGHKLTKLEIDGTTDPQIIYVLSCSDTETKKVAYFLLRNGNMTGSTEMYILQSGASDQVKGHSVVDWANKSVSASDGELLKNNWLDDNTVELWISTETGELGHTTWYYRIDPNNAGDDHGGEYIGKFQR